MNTIDIVDDEGITHLINVLHIVEIRRVPIYNSKHKQLAIRVYYDLTNGSTILDSVRA